MALQEKLNAAKQPARDPKEGRAEKLFVPDRRHGSGTVRDRGGRLRFHHLDEPAHHGSTPLNPMRTIPITESHPDEWHVAGIIVQAHPERTDEITHFIASIADAEIHATGPTGKLVV